MVAASTAATPPTTLEPAPLSTCRRPRPSCHDGGPPRSRATVRSTTAASSTGTDTIDNETPTITASATSGVTADPANLPASAATSTNPAPAGSSRQDSRSRTPGTCRVTPSGSSATRRSANTAVATASAGVPMAMPAIANHGGRTSSENTLWPARFTHSTMPRTARNSA